MPPAVCFRYGTKKKPPVFVYMCVYTYSYVYVWAIIYLFPLDFYLKEQNKKGKLFHFFCYQCIFFSFISKPFALWCYFPFQLSLFFSAGHPICPQTMSQSPFIQKTLKFKGGRPSCGKFQEKSASLCGCVEFFFSPACACSCSLSSRAMEGGRSLEECSPRGRSHSRGKFQGWCLIASS